MAWQRLEWLLVFSTYVEVILTTVLVLLTWLGILHVCGGDPNVDPHIIPHWWYSPRMWR